MVAGRSALQQLKTNDIESMDEANRNTLYDGRRVVIADFVGDVGI